MNEIEQIRSVVESRGRFCFLEEEGCTGNMCQTIPIYDGLPGKRGEIRWQTVRGSCTIGLSRS